METKRKQSRRKTKAPLQRSDIPRIWSRVTKEKAEADSYQKQWLWGQVIPFDSIMKSAYSLTFLKAYILLKAVERSCLNGHRYQNRQGVERCSDTRDAIAHDSYSIDRATCEQLTAIIEAELRHWDLL